MKDWVVNRADGTTLPPPHGRTQGRRSCTRSPQVRGTDQRRFVPPSGSAVATREPPRRAARFSRLASPVTDWLFMLCLLGVGTAVMLGIGLRISAIAGSLLMVSMWIAEWPLLQGSTNPIVDYHVIYALVLVLCATLLAGDTWGLGRRWARLPLVQRFGWLR